MSFTWITPAQRRKQETDEAFAAEQMAKFARQYQDHVERINRATDADLNEAMAEIHRQQRDVKVLQPARARPVDGRPVNLSSTPPIYNGLNKGEGQ
jgi:hypothetical protein